jgi:branched-chain amino acid transport system ATP-binding protein
VSAAVTPRLAVDGLEAGWDRTSVVRGATLDVAGGELVAVLGGNGAGKSTLLWAVSGLLRPRSGRVVLDGRDVTGLPAARLAALGLRLLPQSRRVFPSLTVGENLETPDLAVGRPDRATLRDGRDDWLGRFPVLARRRDEPAGALSGGEQQLLAIGRVVSTHPRVILLDEPSAGLAPAAAEACGQVFVDLAANGVAIVMVEQNVDLARRLATRVVTLRDGHLSSPAAEPAG